MLQIYEASDTFVTLRLNDITGRRSDIGLRLLCMTNIGHDEDMMRLELGKKQLQILNGGTLQGDELLQEISELGIHLDEYVIYLNEKRDEDKVITMIGLSEVYSSVGYEINERLCDFYILTQSSEDSLVFVYIH